MKFSATGGPEDVAPGMDMLQGLDQAILHGRKAAERIYLLYKKIA
jgi:hypothetical protein